MNADSILTITNVEDFNNNPPSFDVAVAMLRNPKVEAETLDAVARSAISEMIRVKVLENPNVTEQILKHLAGNCVLVWPQVIEAFRRIHPARQGAIDTEARYSNEFLNLSSGTEIAHYFLDYGQALIFDFWHDLSSRGLLRLLFAPNRKDDFFGPFGIDGMEEADFGSPLIQIFGHDSNLTDEFDGWLSEEVLWEPENWKKIIDDGDQSEKIVGAPANQQEVEAYENSLFEIMQEKHEHKLNFEAVVRTDPPHLGKVRYRDLDTESQKNFSSLVARGQSHYLIQSLGINKHLAKLLLMHPATQFAAREVLISSDVLNLARFSKPSSDKLRDCVS